MPARNIHDFGQSLLGQVGLLPEAHQILTESPLILAARGLSQCSEQHKDLQYDDATLNKIKTLKVSVQWNNISIKAALDDLTS